MRGELVSGCDAAFFDAGAGGDPLIAGFDAFFEFGIGENFLRHVAASAGDGHSGFAHGDSVNGLRELVKCKVVHCEGR